MPRPDFSKSKTGGTTSKNPFSAWAARRREAKQAAAEEASRLITNDTAKNESALVGTLASIDFLHSRLPKSALEAKSDPKHSCGDLEFAARGIQQKLIKNPQTISVDLRLIDEKLMTLAVLFKQAVEQGDEQAAFAAKAGLVRGFNQIRCKIPENQPEFSKLFVESNANYLESWVTLVNMAQVADRIKQNNDRQRDLYNDELAKEEQETDALYELLKSDPEFHQAYQSILNNDSPEGRSHWTEKEREVHVMMIERRMSKARLNLKNLILLQGEREQAVKENQVKTLYAKVANLPIVADPDQMNKFREEIDKLFQDLSRSDVEIDETLQFMDEIDGRIEQLSNAPGALRAKEVAAEQAEETLEDIKRLQLKRAGVLDAQVKAGLRDLGLYSEEELQARLREIAEEEARNEEFLEDSDSEALYN